MVSAQNSRAVMDELKRNEDELNLESSLKAAFYRRKEIKKESSDPSDGYS